MGSKIESVLHKRIEVLGKGFVELCDYMGNDETVVRSARQSYDKDEDELSEEKIDNQIRDMMCKGHTSPFEQVVFQFHLRMPIFVARQWVRFRTARLNEISGRYSSFNDDDFFGPDDDIMKCRSSYKRRNFTFLTNEIEQTSILKEVIGENNTHSFEAYKKLIDMGIPKEISRLALPLTLMTEFYWQMDLHNLLHFLELRMEEHAQKEIREYAMVIYCIVKRICPSSVKHFIEYKYNHLNLGESEIETLYKLFKDLPCHLTQDMSTLFLRIKDMRSHIQDRNDAMRLAIERVRFD